MVTTQKVAIGEQFRIAGGGFEAPFRGRVATLLGYTRRGWARVRLDDAGPREASISAERDETTGRPIVLLFPDRLRGADDPSGE